MKAAPYREIWLVDFEFYGGPGNRPVPLCMVAREYYSRREIRLWQHELAHLDRPPFPIGESSMVVAFYASAESGCFKVLGWPAPERFLDLFTEFRVRFNISAPSGSTDRKQKNTLIAALVKFGLNHIDHAEKDEMRNLILAGGPFSGYRLAVGLYTPIGQRRSLRLRPRLPATGICKPIIFPATHI